MPPGSVAVIGGGISGLVCAHRLRQLGVTKVVVFDTGRRGPGGRCSSRNVTIDDCNYTFDHSAQFFTTSHPRFQRVVEFLLKEKACTLWKGVFGTLDIKDGKFKSQAWSNAYIGVDGMLSIPRCLARDLNVRSGVWINEVHFDDETRQWRLPRGECFDYLVVAHNGKCAARLMSSTPATDIHRALLTRFGPRLPPSASQMQLCSLWVLMAAFESSLGLPFDAAHIRNDADVSWLGNNSRKYPHNGQLECWTVFSTREFGGRHKAPQENVPPAKRRQVTELLLGALKRAIQRVTGRQEMPSVRFTTVQLWGAAVPLNTVRKPMDGCLLDAFHHVGVCGDWLESPCLEGAAISGLKLADRLVANMKGDQTSILLPQLEFKPFPCSEIGHFPDGSTTAQ